jgi:tetratricopeptide (TPR) repeat protein
MAAEVYSFSMPLGDFDASLLPAAARTPGSPAFSAAVHDFLQKQFKGFGGTARIQVDADKIEVIWSAGTAAASPLDAIVAKLSGGQLAEGIILLELLRSHNPEDPQVLYNLGMAYSETGALDRAEECLRTVVGADPQHVNAQVALGVALTRTGRTQEAVVVLQKALELEPGNFWALRNLGGCLLKLGKHAEGLQSLQKAVAINPTDQQAQYGLGQAFLLLNRMEEADQAFIRTINIDQRSQIAELAKQARSKIGHQTFHQKGGSGERFDAVMYCLGALEKFDKMPKSNVQDIGFEIALLGMSGLDVNDPTQKYRLKSLSGQFSGLHLVCLMYAAFRAIDPNRDVGFDLSKEYKAALAMHEKKKKS